MRISTLRPLAVPVFRLRGAGLVLAALAASSFSALNSSSAYGQEAEEPTAKTLFLTANRVIVRPGHVLENASVIVEDGMITAVGADLTAPEGAESIQGEVICAAFMDPWSTAGIEPASARAEDVNAATQAVDALDPYGQVSILQELTGAGVLLTRSQVGRMADFSGIGAIIRTATAEALLPDAAVSVTIGAPRASSVNFNQRGSSSFTLGPQSLDPIERLNQIDKLASELEGGAKYAGDVAKYEQELAEWELAIAEKEKELADDFKKAKKARDKAVDKAEEDGKDVKEKKYKEDKRPREPRFDAEKAAFADVVQGKMPLVVYAERALEIRDMLRISAEYPRLRLVIAGGTSSLACKAALVERNVTVIVAPSPAKPGGPVGELDPGLALAAELDAAGINVLIGSGGATARASRDLPLLAALAVSHGLSRDAALRAITSGPARVFDVADQVGTIKRGHSAELLVMSGDPLSSSSRVLAAISGGVVAPTASR